MWLKINIQKSQSEICVPTCGHRCSPRFMHRKRSTQDFYDFKSRCVIGDSKKNKAIWRNLVALIH